uniref:Transmembrane protein 144 n=1 Tax=Heterorhabditis bacteriophora TaxID=37862 RepID=A0A1I7X7P2_HETBA
MEQSVPIGIISGIVSTVTFGSTYVPVRWFEAGDGLYFQWLMAIGQFMVGMVVLASSGWPPIYPVAMLGGVFFTLGNALTVYIMDGLGMAIGSLMWNTVTCVCGWAVSRFGLFGTPKMIPHDNIMNVIGVLIVCVGGCFFATIKHHPMKVRPAPWQFDIILEDEKVEALQTNSSKLGKRLLCLFLTVVVGAFYGNVLTPINYLITKSGETGMPADVAPYFFSHCIGAVLTATIIFMFYSIYRKNRPFINPEITLPSLTSGIIYGIAMCTFFMANQHLGQGKWDVIQLITGIIVTIIGIALTSVSKVNFQ